MAVHGQFRALASKIRSLAKARPRDYGGYRIEVTVPAATLADAITFRDKARSAEF
jgi:hypothetical protein